MGQAPPAVAEAALLAPTSELVHRIEIYESDGVTRWQNGTMNDRLLGGSVNVDYSRDERRSMDLELDNEDFGLQHAPSAFWYDKILKVFSGVKFVDTTPEVTQRVRYNLHPNPSGEGATTVGYAPYTGSTVTKVAAGDAVSGSNVIEITRGTAGAGLLMMLYPVPIGPSSPVSIRFKARLKPGATAGLAFSMSIQGYQGGTGRGAATGGTASSPVLTTDWQDYTLTGYTMPSDPTINQLGVQIVPTTSWLATDGIQIDAVMIEASLTLPPTFWAGDTQNFANRVYGWSGTAHNSTSTETTTIVTNRAVDSIWEAQIGEFLIDNISEDHFPNTVKVNGRDYTKRCMMSKFATATAFASGTPIENAIKSMAQVAGIVKFLLPLTGRSLGKDYVFERGVSRWEGMKEIATAFGYEIFFDAQGFLVLREHLDPVTAPVSYTLLTGPDAGNLASYTKSLNDNRIYNHMVVTGESSDSQTIPVYAEALNTDPLSPTRISKIGDRVYQYTSIFITTETQAQDVADKFLKIHALEEFDLNFASLALPWLEVGEIIRFEDPRPNAGQPDRFLLSSLTLPLGLGTMGGNAKRVSLVG